MNIQLPPLEIRTRADDCYLVLKAAIINLELSPGLEIDEGSLARQLGVSKTPVREALTRLAGEGFVQLGSGRRSMVAELSRSHVFNVYDLRILIECASIQRVADDLTDDDFKQLSMLVSQLETTSGLGKYLPDMTGTHAFHAFLISKSENDKLIEMFKGLTDHADRIGALIFQSEQRPAEYQKLWRRSIESHRTILDTLMARNGEEAARLLEADIRIFMDAALALPILDESDSEDEDLLDGRRPA